MPMAPVSPSPLTPIASSLRFASTAPVPTDGMRPCTLLKPCEEPRKYAGLLLEQPIPESLITCLGSMPISKKASMMRSEMALWPQPAQSVVLPPRYNVCSRPIRLVFFGESGMATDIVLFIPHERRRRRGLRRRDPFLREDFVCDRTGIDR